MKGCALFVLAVIALSLTAAVLLAPRVADYVAAWPLP